MVRRRATDNNPVLAVRGSPAMYAKQGFRQQADSNMKGWTDGALWAGRANGWTAVGDVNMRTIIRLAPMRVRTTGGDVVRAGVDGDGMVTELGKGGRIDMYNGVMGCDGSKCKSSADTRNYMRTRTKIRQPQTRKHFPPRGATLEEWGLAKASFVGGSNSAGSGGRPQCRAGWSYGRRTGSERRRAGNRCRVAAQSLPPCPARA